MLAEDNFATPRIVRSSNTAAFIGPLAVVVLVKSLRFYAVTAAYELVRDDGSGSRLSVVTLAFWMFVVASVALMLQHRPWPPRRQLPSSGELAQAGAYGAFLVLAVLLFLEAVQHCGPLRAVMTADYSDLAVIYLLGVLLGRFHMYEDKIKGATVMLVAYALMFILQRGAGPDGALVEGSGDAAVAHNPGLTKAVDLDDPLDGVLSGAGSAGRAQVRSLVHLGGLVDVPDRAIGGVAVAVAVVLGVIRKSIALRLGPQIGSERLFTLGTVAGALLLAPLVLLQSLFAAAGDPVAAAVATDGSVSAASTVSMALGWADYGWVALVALLILVLDFNVEVFSRTAVSSSHMAKTSVCATFVFACVHSWAVSGFASDGLPSTITLVCFAILFLGMYLFFSEAHTRHTSLPLYSRMGHQQFLAAATPKFSALSFFKLSMKQILEESESRSIFLFLSVNLGFMFVELMYGLWTNSLGLISDAFHMLFDCVALAIGLYASVISRWDANKSFTFGYARVQVLSGFVNGVFLVFIAIFVLWESIERFLEPPEINTDRLLLVSVLGLLVNLVGVWAFHDHHGHSHSHGGGHSHGHSHGHGHDHGHGDDAGSSDDSDDDGGESSGSFNMDGVFLHVLADTLGSVGVIISSLMVQFLGWKIADPICSFCIAIMIFLSVLPLLRSTGRILLLRVPDEHRRALSGGIRQVRGIAGVLDVSDTHFWQCHSDLVVGTVRVQVAKTVDDQDILRRVHAVFKSRGVGDLAAQVEYEGTDRHSGFFESVGEWGNGHGSGSAGSGSGEPIPLFSPNNPLNPAGQSSSFFNVISLNSLTRRDSSSKRPSRQPQQPAPASHSSAPAAAASSSSFSSSSASTSSAAPQVSSIPAATIPSSMVGVTSRASTQPAVLPKPHHDSHGHSHSHSHADDHSHSHSHNHSHADQARPPPSSNPLVALGMPLGFTGGAEKSNKAD